MKALTYQGSRDVRVETVPDPVLLAPDDIILRITATAICGSDLHLFRGKVPMLKDGDILGHEFMGVVEETGPEVKKVEVGDRVVVPFVIACGSCFFCERQYYASCETTNPGPGGAQNSKGLRPSAALFGYSGMYGGIPGGQAEYVRVPRANIGPLVIPDGLADERVLFLSDILPTAWQAVLNGEVGPGSSVVIYGAGPVGLLCAACARFRGAEVIFIVDNQDYRLNFARDTYGAVPINFEKTDAAEEIMQRTAFRGVDAAIDAVGFEAKGSTLESVLAAVKLEGGSGAALRQCIAAVRRSGVVSVPGVYAGPLHGFGFGDAFDKGLTFKMGQTHVQRYLPELLKLIQSGDLNPEAIITHRLSLRDAARGYDVFDKQEDSCRKVVLLPAMAPAMEVIPVADEPVYPVNPLMPAVA
jgi:threonine dehydrogenase-like Zn-dependent dehydrogenase